MIMGKKLKSLLLFGFIFFSVFTIKNIKDILINKENIQGTYMKISRNYFLESGDTSESTVILHVNEHEDICFLIKELVNEGDKYIVGNITFDEAPKFGCNEKLKNKYNGYFYINYFDDNDARFNLTRDEIKSKFNKKLKYKKAKKFLNEYGDGVIDLTEEIIFFNFFFSFFLTSCVWIIILILKKINMKIFIFNKRTC